MEEKDKKEKKEKKGLIDLIYDRPITSVCFAWIGANLITGIVSMICEKE